MERWKEAELHQKMSRMGCPRPSGHSTGPKEAGKSWVSEEVKPSTLCWPRASPTPLWTSVSHQCKRKWVEGDLSRASLLLSFVDVGCSIWSPLWRLAGSPLTCQDIHVPMNPGPAPSWLLVPPLRGRAEQGSLAASEAASPGSLQLLLPALGGRKWAWWACSQVVETGEE